MRNLLAFLAAAALTVTCVGWYLDWFRLQSVPGAGGHRSVTIDINTRKIGRDLNEVEHKVEKKLADKNQANAEAAPPPDSVKPIVRNALHKLGDVIEQPNR